MSELVAALRDPTRLRRCSPAVWSTIFREAVQAQLVPHILRLAEQGGAGGRLPQGLQQHLRGVQWKLDAQRAQTFRELNFIKAAMAACGIEPVLLKGAAYHGGDLPVSHFRFYGDVDLLVPEQALPQVEHALSINGWVEGHQDPHDQRFYREWMHELPPRTHVQRLTTIDLHHTITPRTSRWPVDGQALCDAAVPAVAAPGFKVLAPPDMVLHCMVHILLNEDLRHGLRDLVDLTLLLHHFSAQDAGFWPTLEARAAELGLARLHAEGLALAHRLLGAEVPAASRSAPSGAGRLRVRLWCRALQPARPGWAGGVDAACRIVHYAAALAVRMPLHLSLRHFGGKAWRSLRERGPRKA